MNFRRDVSLKNLDMNLIIEGGNTQKFGGMKTRGLGISIDFGTTGTTYNDPRSNAMTGIDVIVWRWRFSARFHWKKSFGYHYSH